MVYCNEQHFLHIWLKKLLHCYIQVASIYMFGSVFSVERLLLNRFSSIAERILFYRIVVPKLKSYFCTSEKKYSFGTSLDFLTMCQDKLNHHVAKKQ